MATAKSITYKLRAEYEGKGDVKQLSADLKSLGQIESLNTLQETFVATNKAMVDAKAKVRSLKQDMKDSGGDAFAAEYEKARKEVVKLNTSLQNQKEKLNAARTSLQDQGVNVGELAAKYDQLSASADTQARTIAARQALQVRSWNEIEAEIKGLELAYKDLEKSGTLSTAELAAAQEKLRVKTASLNAQMTGSVKKYSKISTAMTGMKKVASSMITPLTTMVGAIGLIGAGYGIASMVTDVVAAEKEIENMSRTAGMSAGEFQAYSFGVKTVGLEMDKLADISKDVRDKIGDFIETGGGEFADFFENIGEQAGITAEELIKLSGPDALIAVKKAMDDANVSAENQVFYFEAIANDASLLIPLLEDNGAAWKQLAEQAKEMGVAISDLDHQELLDLAKTMSELQLAMGITKREAVLALAPALKELSTYVTENTDEIRDFVTALAEGVGELARFVIENRETIAWLGKSVVALYAVSVAGNALVGTVKLLRAGLAALGPVGALGVAAFASVGYAITANVSRYRELNQLAEETTALMGANAAAGDALAAKYREISSATGVTVTSMEELDAAVAAGKIHFDETTAAWKSGAATMSTAVSTSAATQERVTKESLEAMEKQYQEYAAEVQRLQEEIASRSQSLAAELRDMARSGMSGVDAWKDQKAQAEEYMKIAEKAAAAGDFSTALTYADEAKQLYKGLNTEIKDGETVLVSQQEALKIAMAGVKEAGELGISVLKEQQDAAATAMEELQSGTAFIDLAKSMDESKQQWLENWQAMRKGSYAELEKVEDKIDKIIYDREMDVYVNVVEQRAMGGAIGSAQYLATGGRVALRNMLGGGSFPGYGGGDRRHVVAEDGEVMIRKESVKKAGLSAALAFNAGRFDLVVQELSKRFNLDSIYRNMGGIINPVPKLSLPALSVPQALASGGQVTGVDGSVIRHEHTLSAPNGNQAMVYSDDINAERLIAVLQNAMVSSS